MFMRQLLRSTLCVFCAGLAVTLLFRLLFFIFFKTLNTTNEFKWVSLAFLHGLRFDLSALCFMNFIFVLLIYFKKIRQNMIFLNTWAMVNVLYVCLLVADFFYYSVYNTRLSWEFLAVFNGLQIQILISMLSQFLIAFPILILSFLVFQFLLKKLFKHQDKVFRWAFYPGYCLVITIVFVLAYRGGVQKRVLSPQHTWLFANGSSFNAAMTSNTLHNLLRQGKAAKLPSDFQNISRPYLNSWNIENKEKLSLLKKKPQNVLFIFVESMSSYAYEKNYLPKLKNWLTNYQKDLYFNPYFYANGNLSKDALLSVFFGIPSYFNIHFFESKYSKNTIAGIGQLADALKKETFFLHAAPAGTQFFDVISKAAGFKSYISMYDKFKDQPSKISAWGVHDEVLYEEAIKHMNELKEPFIGTLFTTSTHTPFYGTPNNPDNKEDEVDYFLALNYADDSLVNFFNKASKEEWYKDTLFIITGDHSPPISATWNRQLNEMSRIPLIMYWPESNMNHIKFRSIGRHVDIPRTVFDILGEYPSKWSAYGQSLVKDNADQNVFYTNSGMIHLIAAPNRIMVQSIYDEDEDTVLEDLKEKSLETVSLRNENSEMAFGKKSDVLFQKAEDELKDYIYRLENNALYN